MKILITGISGFVGRHLAELLLTKSHEVYGIHRWRSPKEDIRHLEGKVKLYDADLRDLSSLLKVLDSVRPQKVFHLAAQSYVPASFSYPKDTFEVNAVGTLNLLDAIRILKIDPKVHICSTADVYGEVRKGEVPISELNLTRPVSPYAVSKVSAELIAKQYFVSFGVKSVITRAFNHTGPGRGEVFAESSFAKQIIEIEKSIHSPTILVGNLKSVRTFADVRDIVKAYVLALEKGKPGEVYNIAGDTTLTMEKILDILISLSSAKSAIKVKVDKARLRPKDAVSRLPDDKKFRRLSGWKPQIPIEQTLSDLLDYWRVKL